uniref:3-oxoacyl-(Acyl-carrier-protein) reductase, putative n=1 Tax=Chlorobium chlorochromatii (strain CaD3) TaxID=340177 RepID=Q3ATZ0_CHLCH
MQKNISQKTCFMTGATGVLGSAIAEAIAKQGYSLFFTWNGSEAKALLLLERLQAISPHSAMVRCDVAQPSAIAEAFIEFRERYQRLDLLVASASNFFRTTLPEVTEAEWDALVNTNLKGTFFTMQEAARMMQQQSFVSRIITMTDISANLAWRGFAPYTASKAAIQHITRLFAKTFAPTILVNSIAPGTITLNPEHATEAALDAVTNVPLRRTGEPADIVRTVLFLLEQEYMTGQILAVDGGRLLA